MAEPAPARKAEVPTALADLAAPEAPGELGQPRTPALDVDALLARRWPPYSRFPASSDGRVALAIASADGSRNNPNLTVRIVDLETLTPTSEIVLLGPDEWESASPDQLRSRVTERAERAQHLLDEGGFEAMTLAYESVGPDAGHATANAAGVIIEWNRTRRVLSAVDEADGRERLRRVIDLPASECREAPTPHLLAAFIDTDAHVLVARVGHERTEACAHPDDRWLVLPLSPMPEEEEPEE